VAWETTGRLGWSIRGGGFASLLIDSDIYGTERQRVFYSANMAILMVNQFRLMASRGLPDWTTALPSVKRYRTLLPDKLKLSLNTLLLASLRKLDKQYDNERYSYRHPRIYRGSAGLLRVNSRASNISLLVNAGLSYRLF
jgi:hypothetical protein